MLIQRAASAPAPGSPSEHSTRSLPQPPAHPQQHGSPRTQIAWVGKVQRLIRIPNHRNARRRKVRRPGNPARSTSPQTRRRKPAADKRQNYSQAARSNKRLRSDMLRLLPRRQHAHHSINRGLLRCHRSLHRIRLTRHHRQRDPARNRTGNRTTHHPLLHPRRRPGRSGLARQPGTSPPSPQAQVAAIRHRPRQLRPKPPKIDKRRLRSSRVLRQRRRHPSLPNRNRSIKPTHRRTHARPRSAHAATSADAALRGNAGCLPPTSQPTRAKHKVRPQHIRE